MSTLALAWRAVLALAPVLLLVAGTAQMLPAVQELQQTQQERWQI